MRVKPSIWALGLVIAMAVSWGTAAADRPAYPSIVPDRVQSIVPGEEQRNPPRYPKEAAEARREGTTVLLLLVGVDGVVEQAQIDISSGFADLDAAAIAAGSRWRFLPRIEHGFPVRCYARVPVTFNTNTDPNLPPGQIEQHVTPNPEPPAPSTYPAQRRGSAAGIA